MNRILDSEEFLVCVAHQAYTDSDCTKIKRVDSRSTAIEIERQPKGGIHLFDSKTTTIPTPSGSMVGYGRPKLEEKVMVFSVPSLRLELIGRSVLEVPLEDLPKLLIGARNSDRWIAKARLELGI